ncbi:caspase, EACC1-associated type [Streptomyces sp. NPDC054837]
MVRLPDPARSRLVLIGTARYASKQRDSFPDVDAIAGNLASMRALLCDPDLGGFSAESCTLLPDPATPTDIQNTIREAAGAATDVLLVYYTGHGHRPQGRELFLTCSSSSPDTVETTGVYYPFLRGWLQDSQAAVTVLVLDCCFSGKAALDLHANGALGDRTAPPPVLLNQDEVDIDGVCVLASSGPTQVSGADDGEGHTLFTGHLVAALRHGIPNEDRLLPVRALYEQTRRTMAAAQLSLQLPLLGSTGTADALALAHNPAFKDTNGVELTDLMHAQVQAARELPYRVFGSRAPLLPDIYVRQLLRAPSTHADSLGAEKDGHQPQATLRLPLSALLQSDRHRCVIAGPGGGKSTMTLHLTASLATSWLSDATGADLLPLRVSARQLASRLSRSWQTALAEALTAELGSHLPQLVAPDLLATPPDGTRWLVIIDGLDEITDPDTRAQLIAVLDGMVADTTGQGPRLLMTTRPLDVASNTRVQNFVHTDHYTLEPFDRDTLKDFAHTWFGDRDQELATDFLRRLDDARIAELAQVPLLATVAAVMVEQRPDRKLPTSRFALYEAFITHLLARGRSRTPADSSPAGQLHSDRVDLLELLAIAHLEGIDDLASAVRDSRPPPDDYKIRADEWGALLTATLTDTGLVTVHGGALRFLHQSFAEHLAARVVARELPDVYASGSEQWKELVLAATPRGYGRPPAVEVARLALEHHTHHHPDNNLIRSLQRSRAADRRLLAGQLLATGVEAAPDHTDAFLTDLGNWCRQQAQTSRPGDAFRRTRAGLEMLPHLPHQDRAVRWVRSVVRTSSLRGDILVRAALQLAAMGDEYRQEAADILERLAPVLDEHSYGGPEIWEALAELGADGRQRAACRAEATWRSFHEPRALSFLARLGPSHREDVLTVITEEAQRYSTTPPGHPAGRAAEFIDTMQDVLAVLRPEAIPLLRTLTDPLPPGHALDEAMDALLRLAPHLDTHEAILLLAPLLTPGHGQKAVRARLVRHLATRGNAAARLLLTVLADPAEDDDVRSAALGVQTTDPLFDDILLVLATDPGRGRRLRSGAVKHLLNRARPDNTDRLAALLHSSVPDDGHRFAAADHLLSMDTAVETRERALATIQEIGANTDAGYSTRWRAAKLLLRDDRWQEPAIDIMVEILPQADWQAARSHIEQLRKLNRTHDPRVVHTLLGWIRTTKGSWPYNDGVRRDTAIPVLASAGPAARAALAETLVASLHGADQEQVQLQHVVRNLAQHDQALALKILRDVLCDQKIDYHYRLDAALELYWWQDSSAPQGAALTLQLAATGPRSQRIAATRKLTWQRRSGRRRRWVLPPDAIWKLDPVNRRRALTHYLRLRLRQTIRLLGWLVILTVMLYGITLVW